MIGAFVQVVKDSNMDKKQLAFRDTRLQCACVGCCEWQLMWCGRTSTPELDDLVGCLGQFIPTNLIFFFFLINLFYFIYFWLC